MKNIRVFHLKIFSFLKVKFSIYLNRHVFVMLSIFLFHHSVCVCLTDELDELYTDRRHMYVLELHQKYCRDFTQIKLGKAPTRPPVFFY